LEAKTYKAIEILNFGWINCDRFWNETGPKSNIELHVEDSLITTAQFYLVFKDIKSTMSDVFYKQQKTVAFQQIPSGKNVVIVGLAVRNGDCYIFEHSLTTPNENKVVPVVFKKTTQEDLIKSIKKI